MTARNIVIAAAMSVLAIATPRALALSEPFDFEEIEWRVEGL